MGFWIEFFGLQFLTSIVVFLLVCLIAQWTDNKTVIGWFYIAGGVASIAVPFYIAKKRQHKRTADKIDKEVRRALEHRDAPTSSESL